MRCVVFCVAACLHSTCLLTFFVFCFCVVCFFSSLQGYPLELANWFSVWSMMYTQEGRYHWMLQYYMRDAGVALSWVGTGRCLFALDWTEADYDELLKRMLKACEMMKAGGWWEPPQVNINATVGKEFVVAIAKMIVGL